MVQPMNSGFTNSLTSSSRINQYILVYFSFSVTRMKVLDTLLPGFLTDDLTVATNMKGGMMKYLGVCKLPGTESKHRRIDIIVAPYSQVCCTGT